MSAARLLPHSTRLEHEHAVGKKQRFFLIMRHVTPVSAWMCLSSSRTS